MYQQFYEENLALAKKFKQCSEEQKSILEAFINENAHIFPFIVKALSYKGLCDYEDALSIVRVCALKTFKDPNAYHYLQKRTFWKIVENEAKKMLHAETRADEGSYATVKLKQRKSGKFSKSPFVCSLDASFCDDTKGKECSLRDATVVGKRFSSPSLEKTFIQEYLKSILFKAVSDIEDDRTRYALIYSYKDYPYNDVSERTYYRKRKFAADHVRMYLTLKGLSFDDFLDC